MQKEAIIMYEFFSVLFLLSLTPTIAITCLFNREWSKYPNPTTRRRQAEFNGCAVLAIGIATTLFFWLLTKASI
jgi:hypothetical protein